MNGEVSGSGILGGGIAVIVMLAFFAVMIASVWKVFTKAGQPGWAALVPVYNMIVLLKITGKPLWFFVLFMIPFVNFFALIMVALGLAKSFGKGTGFGIGLICLSPVFYPMLAFGDARYVGPASEGNPALAAA